MTTTRAQVRSKVFRAGSVLAAMMMAQALTSTAEAGCLHDALSRADRERIAAVLESLTGDLADNLGDPVAPHREPQERGPCTGAACSGMPGVPPSIPRGVHEVLASMWACLPTWKRTPALDQSPLTEGKNLLRPVLLADPVFHPPRLSRLGA